MKKRHDNYNKRATKKQTAAQKRNFDIFRLRGMVVVLKGMLYHDMLRVPTTVQLVSALRHVREALIAETGK